MEQKRKRTNTPPPRYDDAFKSGAIHMVTEGKCPAREVAAELGICHDTLRNCLKSAGVVAGTVDHQNNDNRRLRELENEVRTLRKQLQAR